MTIHFAPANGTQKGKGKKKGLGAGSADGSGKNGNPLGAADGTHGGRFAGLSWGRIKLGRPANDNTPARVYNAGRTGIAGRAGLAEAPSEKVIEAALRHFAQHGLGAARAARIKAKQAFFEGDRAAYDWWTSITYALDRRLAAEKLPFSRNPADPQADQTGSDTAPSGAANSNDKICELPPGNAG